MGKMWTDKEFLSFLVIVCEILSDALEFDLKTREIERRETRVELCTLIRTCTWCKSNSASLSRCGIQKFYAANIQVRQHSWDAVCECDATCECDVTCATQFGAV